MSAGFFKKLIAIQQEKSSNLYFLLRKGIFSGPSEERHALDALEKFMLAPPKTNYKLIDISPQGRLENWKKSKPEDNEKNYGELLESGFFCTGTTEFLKKIESTAKETSTFDSRYSL
jgi:hypothetical protein